MIFFLIYKSTTYKPPTNQTLTITARRHTPPETVPRRDANRILAARMAKPIAFHPRIPHTTPMHHHTPHTTTNGASTMTHTIACELTTLAATMSDANGFSYHCLVTRDTLGNLVIYGTEVRDIADVPKTWRWDEMHPDF